MQRLQHMSEAHNLSAKQAAVTQPEPAVQQFFEDVASKLPSKSRDAVPLWVKKICEYRSDFTGLCLGASFEEGDTVYRLLYCVQNPRLMVFQEAVVLLLSLPSLASIRDDGPISLPRRRRVA